MAEPQPGQILHATYRLEGLVGKGAMGAVYEASHTRLSRRFAVKMLARHALPSAEARARFEREAEVTSKLKHPNIVDVIDFNHAPDGTPYIVMELLVGTDLRSRLGEVGRFEPPEMARLLRQAAAGLQAAHDHGIVHRDLKPSNIFICSGDGAVDTEVVKLVDFGLSKRVDVHHGLTMADELIGTPWYMSPEQADGRAAEATVQSDLFSLAVIVYEMVTGTVPFRADNLLAALRKIVVEDPPAMSSLGVEVPSALEAVVIQALAKRPEDRHGSVQEFAQKLCDAAAPAEDVGRTLDWEPPVAIVSPASAGADSPAPTATVTGVPGEMEVTTLAVKPPPAARTTGRIAFVVTLGVLGGVGMWLGLTLGEPPLGEPLAGPPLGPDLTLATAPAGSPDLARVEPDLAPVASTAPDATARRGPPRREVWLTTRPPGATVHVDGTFVGSTPIEGRGVSTDAVVLVLHKARFLEHRIDLPPGTEPIRLGQVALRPAARPRPPVAPRPPAPRTGTLQVSTMVDGQHTPADVYLDNTLRGQSPLRLEQIRAGVPLTLTIRKAGFRAHVRQIQLQPGRISRIFVDLKR